MKNLDKNLKQELKEIIKDLKIKTLAKVVFKYNGAGDEGSLEYPQFFDKKGIKLGIENDISTSRIEDFVYHNFIPSGLEICEGGYGTITIDIAGGEVKADLFQRVEASEPIPEEYSF